MKRLFFCTVLLTTSGYATHPLISEAEEFFKQTSDRIESKLKEIEKEHEEMIGYLQINSKDIITIDQTDTNIAITFAIPGLNTVNAQIEDDVLRITDDKDHIEIIIEDAFVHANVNFSFKEEKKDANGSILAQSYFHSAPTLALPGKVNLSNPEQIKVEYGNDKLVVQVPIYVKPVHKITVSKLSEVSGQTAEKKEEKGSSPQVPAHHEKTKAETLKERSSSQKELA